MVFRHKGYNTDIDVKVSETVLMNGAGETLKKI